MCVGRFLPGPRRTSYGDFRERSLNPDKDRLRSFPGPDGHAGAVSWVRTVRTGSPRDSTPGFPSRRFLPAVERTRTDVVRGFFAPVDSRLPDRNARVKL